MQSTSQNKTRVQVVDKHVRILDGGEAAEPAVLLAHPHPFLAVMVNGARVSGRCLVNGTDSVEVLVEDTPPRRNIDLAVADDGLTAVLKLDYEAGTKRTLRPVEPASEVLVTVDEVSWEPAPFSMDEIQQLLAAKQIVFGVNTDAIAALAGSGESGECVCATGVAPLAGTPERYEVCIEESNEITLIGIIPIQPVVSVKPGTVIAQYHPEDPGTDGTNVYGSPVAPPSMRTTLPKLGNGVTLDESGAVIATRSGRLVNLDKLLDVAETLIVERSLRAADGYLIFNGDIVIRGDVEDGCEVVAGGRIFVSGMVSRSTLVGDDGIVVNGGTFASTLRAGTRKVALWELAAHLNDFTDNFKQFYAAVDQVRSALAAKGATVPVGSVAAKLLGERFKGLLQWPQVFEQWAATHGGSAGITWTSYIDGLSAELTVAKLTSVHDASYFVELARQVDDKCSELPDEDAAEADIQVRNAQNCDLRAVGSITSTQQGYYQCHLDAGADIRAVGSPGVVLACEVSAFQVQAREIGSQMETHTNIHLTDKEGSVKCTKLHPGTTLTVGTWRYRVPKEMDNVTWP